jgi:ABC-type multidrug transport system fused ATPase/permease subunit
MLFRFEHAERKIKTHGEDISESVSTLDASVASDDLVARLKEGDAEAVEQVVGEVTANVSKARKGKRSDPMPSGQTGVKLLREAGEGISFWSAFHKRAMRRLRSALFLTLATIGLCLVLLPLMPLLTRRLFLAAMLTAVAVGLSLVCLAMYARLILLLLVPEAEADASMPNKL